MSIIILTKTTVIANGQIAEVRKMRVSTDNAKTWRDAKKDVADLDEAIAQMQANGFRVTLTKDHWRGTGVNSGFATKIVRFVKTDLDVHTQQRQAEETPVQPEPVPTLKKSRKTRKSKNAEQVEKQLAEQGIPA